MWGKMTMFRNGKRLWRGTNILKQNLLEAILMKWSIFKEKDHVRSDMFNWKMRGMSWRKLANFKMELSLVCLFIHFKTFFKNINNYKHFHIYTNCKLGLCFLVIIKWTCPNNVPTSCEQSENLFFTLGVGIEGFGNSSKYWVTRILFQPFLRSTEPSN